MSSKRILLYSHDTYGLGHLRRSLTIAHQLAADISKAHQLLITGSMVAGAFALPPRLDLVKLPALSKRSNGDYTARTLPLTLRNTIAWREQMILQAAINFNPDIFLVDKAPAGVRGELLPALRYLKTWSPQTRIVLGMRDIEDSPEKTQREWDAAGVPQLLEDVYDQILLYGRTDFFNPVTAYNLSPTVADRIVECGYLGRQDMAHNRDWVRRELGIGDKPLVVVTVGGGGDGHHILETAVAMHKAAASPYHLLLVTGPLMSQQKRRLIQQAANLPGLTFIEFTPHLMDYMAAADLVVSMAGYNTVCELLSLRQRTLLIPRMNVRHEQRIRAQLLADRGLAHLLMPADLTPVQLRHAIDKALAAPRPHVDLPLDGVQAASRAIADLLAAKPVRTTNTNTQSQTIAKELVVS